MKTCKKCGKTKDTGNFRTFVYKGEYHRRGVCIECDRKVARENFKIYRTLLNDLKINGCSICGYNKCVDALVFHHVMPGTKNFAVNTTRISAPNEKFFKEFHKCMLLCSNCHREIHMEERE